MASAFPWEGDAGARGAQSTQRRTKPPPALQSGELCDDSRKEDSGFGFMSLQIETDTAGTGAFAF